MKSKEINYPMLSLQFLGIILVVVGHKGGIILFDNFFPLYSFHMPLFIFISGYFFNEKYSIKEFLIKKTKKSLLPLFICNFVYLVISQFLRKNGTILYGHDIGFKSLFITPFTYGNQSRLNSAAWFVLSLFLTSFLYLLIRKLIKHIKFKNEYIITLFFLLLSISGLYFALNGYNSEKFIPITRTLFLLFFYQMGFLYKTKLENKDVLNSWVYFIVLILFQLVILYAFNDLSYVLPYMNFSNSNIFLPFITSITGILFWLRISKILCNCVKNSKIANYIGQNTWTIMMHHQFIFFVFNYLLYITNANITPIEGFDVAAFQSDEWYSYVLNGKSQFLVLYIILGIAIPLSIKYLYDKKKILKIKNSL